MRYHERMIMLSVLDTQWKDHLLNMDHLKEGIGLRGYGQHDPLVEYKRESFDMFEEMMQRSQQRRGRAICSICRLWKRPPAQAAASADERMAISRSSSCRRRKRASTSMDDLEAQFQRRKKKELEQARMAGPTATQRRSRLCAGRPKSGAMILAHAAQGRSIRSATEQERRHKTVLRLQRRGQPITVGRSDHWQLNVTKRTRARKKRDAAMLAASQILFCHGFSRLSGVAC